MAKSAAVEPEGFPELKVDRVVMAGGKDDLLYLDEKWMAREVIAKKLYEIRNADSDERVYTYKEVMDVARTGSQDDELVAVVHDQES